MEFLQATLERAGFTGKALSAATWALYNHVFGSASVQTALTITEAERKVGQERLLADRDSYPTLAANGYLYDDDWDGSFAAGLRFLLDGLQARLTSGGTNLTQEHIPLWGMTHLTVELWPFNTPGGYTYLSYP